MGYARLLSGFIGFLRFKLTNLILKIKKNVKKKERSYNVVKINLYYNSKSLL